MSITTLILGGFNTQPPEGGWFSIAALCRSAFWFQHTAARRRLGNCANQSRNTALFQHTAARRRLAAFGFRMCSVMAFQHTAARRRLDPPPNKKSPARMFQHTAARRRLEGFHNHMPIIWFGFNTQPPEGGWDDTNSTPLQ